ENAEIRAALDERFRYIMVDEYQDTNLAQYAIARGLSIDHPNLAVTGDPDQSIYGWRGANLNNILDFERDFPEVCVVRLERNYRSTQRILRVADELIRHNVRRKEKRLFTENGVGVPVRLVVYQTEQDEARDLVMQIAAGMERGRRPRDFAVFYRVNALSRVFELALREAGIPYQLVQGVQFFQREEIKDMVAYLKAVNNPRDQVAVERIVNTPARGIGKTTFARVAEYAQRRGIAWLEAALHVGEIAAVQKRSAKPVADFARLMRRFGELATGPVEKLLGCVLNDTGYRQRLEAGDERDQERLSNCEELLGVARQFDERYGGQGSLDAFLEDICLVSDTDAWEDTADRVTLMTLHAAKGLEFPCVFLVAVEENLLPHERSKQNEQSLEEERRLMFVGITRAQEELQISRARYRDYRGVRKLTIPSSFLMQLPRDEMELDDRSGGAYGLAPGSGFGASRGALAGPGLGARAGERQGSGDYHPCDDDGWGAPPENEPVFSRPMPAEEAFVGPEDGATEQPANGLSGSSGRKSAPGLPSGTEEGPEDELGTVPIFEVPRRSRGSRKWDCPLPIPDKSEEKPADETSEVSRPRSRPRRSRSAGSYHLMTAAEMAAALGDDSDAAADAANRARSAAEAATGATEPDAFAQGSIVRHAEFGLGRVVALSGAGKKRRAVVDFASTAGRQEIALADGSLRAVK
ncbi:MAG: ATP-dependent helicase, partial [Planctomycetota bacterium]